MGAADAGFALSSVPALLKVPWNEGKPCAVEFALVGCIVRFCGALSPLLALLYVSTTYVCCYCVSALFQACLISFISAHFDVSVLCIHSVDGGGRGGV